MGGLSSNEIVDKLAHEQGNSWFLFFRELHLKTAYLQQKTSETLRWTAHRITEYPELKLTQNDYRVQALAPHRSTQKSDHTSENIV